jgi:hypothetical protein
MRNRPDRGGTGHQRYRPVGAARLRPRLAAVAPSAADVVRCAGGWLFDQAMAGWDVTVITTDHPDPRPLRMLGARDRDVAILREVPVVGVCLEAVAVRSDLYESDEQVRDMVLRAAAGHAEIRVWGKGWPADFSPGPDLVSHHLSLAARAFKAQAVLAFGATGRGRAGDGEVEVFRRVVVLTG